MLGQLGFAGIAVILLVGCGAAALVVLMLLGFKVYGSPAFTLRRYPPHMRPAPPSRRKMVAVGVGVVATFAGASLVGILVADTITTALLVMAILVPLTVFLYLARKPGPPSGD